MISPTAVAHCPYTIDYEIASGRYRESGVDRLVFTLTDEGWQVCWRTLSAEPEVSTIPGGARGSRRRS